MLRPLDTHNSGAVIENLIETELSQLEFTFYSVAVHVDQGETASGVAVYNRIAGAGYGAVYPDGSAQGLDKRSLACAESPEKGRHSRGVHTPCQRLPKGKCLLKGPEDKFPLRS